MSNQIYNVGTFVKHINKPGKIFVVLIAQVPDTHLLKSLPDNNGNYEICRKQLPEIIKI